MKWMGSPYHRLSALLVLLCTFLSLVSLVLAFVSVPIVGDLTNSCNSKRFSSTPSTNSEPTRSTTTTTTSSSSTITTSSMAPQSTALWFQHRITITAPSRGCHLITSDVLKVAGNDISRIQIGMCNLFVQHTSASLSINENADPDVRIDMETALNKIVPAIWNRDGTFRHTMEGDDDMPGHVKSSLMGVSLNIPISNGKLALGTWQGIYLNEHRDQGGWGNGHSRSIMITIQGQSKP